MGSHGLDPYYDKAVSMCNSGMSINQIADKFGVSPQTMRKILDRRGVMRTGTKKKKPEAKDDTLPASICWTCIHAYADDCFLIKFDERDYVLKYEERVCAIHNYRSKKDRDIIIRSVQKCERYERGRRVFCEDEEVFLDGAEETSMAEMC